MSNEMNRIRSLADVVSVDVWHKDFSEGNGRADLHVDVVFDEGRMGGEKESKVRFRLSLKSAEVVLIVPSTEPITIDKSTVARGSDSPRLKKTTRKERTREISAKGEVNANLGANSSSGISGTSSVTGEAIAAVANKSTEISELEEMVDSIKVVQSKTSENHYRWILRPEGGGNLIGKPWDSLEAPRLTIIDGRKNRSHGIVPTVLVEVRCRREDLSISQIEIKDGDLWTKIKAGLSTKNKLVAAEAYIKNRLLNEGLEGSEIHDKFGVLTVAKAASGEV
jgi:hypothetical protein